VGVGDPVVGDINKGCGPKDSRSRLEYVCNGCHAGQPPIDCDGTVFAGVGAERIGKRWYKKQTGRTNASGAYTDGFMVLPVENVYPIEKSFLINIERWAMATQTDAFACTETDFKASGFDSYIQHLGVDHLKVLYIGGGGRLVHHHDINLGERAIRMNITLDRFLADTDEERMHKAAEQLGIDEDNLMIVDPSANPYSRENIIKNIKRFGRTDQFNVVIELAGEGAVTGETVKQMREEGSLAMSSKWMTATHTGYAGGVDQASMEVGLAGHSFSIGLSPRWNIRDMAREFLYRNWEKYEGTFQFLDGGLQNEGLIDLVQNGGGNLKKEMDWGTIVTMIDENPPTWDEQGQPKKVTEEK